MRNNSTSSPPSLYSNINPPWSDTPIETPSDDTLQRDGFASFLSNHFNNSWQATSSSVTGVIGPWGSGKTSAINLTKHHLVESESEWSIGDFTPWVTSDTDILLDEFYKTLISAMPKNISRKYKKLLGRFLLSTSPLVKDIPLGNSISASVSQIGKKLTELPPWRKVFTDLSKEMLKEKRRILIVVDDIDRLNLKELTTLLKCIRLIGRLPGVNYVLLYDEQSIYSTLAGLSNTEKENLSGAETYLQKIIQHPIYLPPLTLFQREVHIRKTWEIALERYSAHAKESSFTDIVNILPHITSLITTPRQLSRLRTTLLRDIARLDGQDYDIRDAFILAVTQEASPSIYSRIYDNRSILISRQTGIAGLFENDTHIDSNYLFRQVADDKRFAIKNILEIAFPNLTDNSRRPHIGDCRVADPGYFDRYFTWSISETDISNTRVLDALKKTGNGDVDPLSSMLANENIAERIIGIIVDPDNSANTPEEALNYMKACSISLPSLSTSSNAFASPRSRIESWIVQLGKYVGENLENNESLSTKLEQVMLNSPIEVSTMLFVELSKIDTPSSSEQVSLVQLLSNLEDAIRSECECLILAHLSAGDYASLESRELTPFSFLAHTGVSDTFREQLHNGVVEGKFTVETIASRCLNVWHTMGQPEKNNSGFIEGVDSELWNAFNPNVDDDIFFSTKLENSISAHDISWKNRRLYSRGRFLK